MEKMLRLTIFLILVLGISLVASGCPSFESQWLPEVPLPRFLSAEEFVNAFSGGQDGYDVWKDSRGLSLNDGFATQAELSATCDYSTTNVQVEGVDEADVVKTDGGFIYAIAGDSVCIVAAYPPEDMRLASRIEFDGDIGLSEMFVNGDRLVVIGYSYVDEGDLNPEHPEYYPDSQLVFIKIFDVSDRTKPRLLNTIEHEGSYVTSRMIEDNVYAVLSSWPGYIIYEDEEVRPDEIIPLYRAVRGDEEPGALEPACDWSEVEYFEREACSSFLSILSMSLEDYGSSVEKREIAGNVECVYASAGNLYVTASDYGWYLDEFESGMGDTVHSTIHKFRFDKAAVSYLASAEVPGTVLNQFSMDEHGGYFRIATTGEGSDGNPGPASNVYVLDPALNTVGRLEGLAPGETIYSARFMGKRAYLVTFEKIDPFFVLDLTNPADPKVLGELKIPGFSDYLHPYDETHVIGVGINAVEADPAQGDFSWFQGMKIALFDVSDVSNPKEMHKVEIGDRGTHSYALEDHKAFLFDGDKGILVLPILLAELTPEQKASGARQPFDYGEITYQGAYVYDISPAGGFDLRGRITHIEDPQELKNSDYYYRYGEDHITRSLYIEDSLYTFSLSGIKANDLENLEERGFVSLK